MYLYENVHMLQINSFGFSGSICIVPNMLDRTQCTCTGDKRLCYLFGEFSPTLSIPNNNTTIASVGMRLINVTPTIL